MSPCGWDMAENVLKEQGNGVRQNWRPNPCEWSDIHARDEVSKLRMLTWRLWDKKTERALMTAPFAWELGPVGLSVSNN
jgi:hypothetical protein